MKFDSMDIVKAMQIIADSSNSKLRLDKTIVAQIISVENIETGEYRVAYEGNTFLAYSYDVTTSFAVNDNVYVKIPENDMTNRKIIEGRVSSSGNTLTDIIEQQVDINVIEPSLDKFYGYDADDSYGIVAGVDSSHPYFMQTIFQSDGSTIGDHMFQSYAANYSKIKLTGSFYTKFVGIHNKGNYGLIVTFKTLKFDDNGREEQGTVSYRLDFSNFVGDPYRYTSPSPQSIIIDVFKESVIGLDSIILFQENFETDRSLNYDNQIVYENKGTDIPPICNIFVQDIDIAFCEVIDLKDTSYYLTIAAPQGIVFSGTTTTLTLDARLKYKGANILAQNSCKTYWYKENLSIKKGDEKYDKLAGVRWENINPVNTDFLASITVASRDVKTHARYKLVVIYQDVTLSKEIEVKQLEASHDLGIQQITRNNSRIVLKVVSKIENDNRDYTGDWYFFLPDGSYDLIPNGEKQLEVDVTDYLIYPTATFYCQTYYRDEPISIEVHDFAISDSQDDLSITYIGEDIFQYDANGDIAYEDTEIDRTLGIKVEWKDGLGAAYSLSYLAPDGQELSNDRTKAYTSTNSMMENLWVDSTNILHYNIRQKYNVNYNNNTITVKIRCVLNGNEYLFRKEILFLKDGDQGTNGTTYICAIRPVNLASGDKLSGFHALKYNGGWLDDGLDLRCYVYKNGDMINGSPNFDLTFQWECGSKNGQIDKLRLATIPGFTNLLDYQRIQGVGSLDTKGDYVVKMTLTVREKSNSERTEIHCQYPVDVAVGGFNMSLVDMNLPSYVKYTASGINAAFLNQELICTYGGSQLPIYSTDETLLQVVNNKLNPVQKFQYSGGIAALRCQVSSSMYLLHPIMMYLDTYGNEAINGWDGTKLEIDDNGKYILAPQVGAGKKNSDNTFTGVVMGQDTAEDKIGLYGYRQGIAQFGFKEDGTAFIGASGDGQILFDGNKGTITSGNYSSTTGMKIDLQNGHIDAYNFKISSGNMLLDSANQRFDFTVGSASGSRFLITHKNGNRLFYIANDAYYLQSQDYIANTQGTKIDLASGRIDSYNFVLSSGNMILNSADQRFDFTVGSSSSSRFQIKHAEGQILFYAGRDNYYLQSKDYSATSQKGIRINLNTGRIDAYTFRLQTPTIDLDSDNSKFEFKVDPTKGQFRVVASSSEGSHVLFNASANSYYLKSFNYSESGGDITGTYIDLKNGTFRAGGNAEFSGKITAKSGTIGGWDITETMLRSSDGKVYLSSTGGFRAGDNFSVTAAGVLTCASANIKGALSADTLSIRQTSGLYANALSQNQWGNIGIDGNFVTCEGLLVGTQNSGNYFAVLSGNVYMEGTMRMGPGSVITWNQLANINQAPFAFPEDLDILQGLLEDKIDDAIDAADAAGASADHAKALGVLIASKLGNYTEIGATYIFTPALDASYITTGTLDAARINAIGSSGRGGITITGADTANSALDISGDSVRITGGSGDVFLSAGNSSYVQCHRNPSVVTISPRLQVGGLDIKDAIEDLQRRVSALESA